jgi:hypothetical protein
MPSISQYKRQQAFLDSGFMDLNSQTIDDIKPFTGDAIAIALYNASVHFVLQAGQNLEKVDRVAGGQLVNSIIPADMIIMGKVMTININVNDYYKFVDQGVKGWKNSNVNSSYSFKAPGKRGSAPKNSKMVTAIKQWLVSEGSKATGKAERKKSISPREAMRVKITDASTSAAIFTTMMIKRKGLKKTNFWADSVSDLQKYIATEFETALKIDVINSLTNGNSSK